MHMREDFPIMPLNSVLFPGTPATLYIHEQRYREMLAECLRGDGFFGVALLRAGKEVGGPGIPHDIGTVAHVAEVTHLPDGSSVVLARGGPRFRIDTITSALPIVRADVEILEEDAAIEPADEGLLVEAREQLKELMRFVLSAMGAEGVEPDVPDDPVRLSYAIAANLQTPLRVQQQLLEMTSLTGRLAMALPMLTREVGHYRVLAAARNKLERLGMIGEGDTVPFSRN
ncbi:MAG: LON peptidase substrate-binding domain-containing protein [Armatimonadota bacterium]